jgi:hypothetical protein
MILLQPADLAELHHHLPGWARALPLLVAGGEPEPECFRRLLTDQVRVREPQRHEKKARRRASIN